jgi:rubredoxin
MQNGMMKTIKKTMYHMKYRCLVCNYIYDMVEGDPGQRIKPGTAFEELPDDWVCPVCAAPKNDFTEVDF